MKIFVWGIGVAAGELLEQELKNTVIEAFIANTGSKMFQGKPVYQPQEMTAKEYDVIVVATGYAREIYEQARQLDLDISKFIFVYGNYVFEDMNYSYELAERIFDSSYIEIMKRRYRVIRSMEQDEIKIESDGSLDRDTDMYVSDYNRIRTFELVSREIMGGGVKGSVAELGVFRGEFAKYINKTFSERTCYLFDTFEGFRESEAVDEKKAGNCGDSFIERFKSTSVQKVLEIMPCPKRIVCKQGLFPESLEGLEDTFAFVSIDVDFEMAIYDGLRYFYPRLNKGGYIFVHDYNSKNLKGVKNAIRRYEDENNTILAKVPIPDLCGTLVITK